jgi:hypothetical protein
MSRLLRSAAPKKAAVSRRATVRWAALGAVAVMLATACGAKTEIVYVDPPGLHGSYQPFMQTTDPRIDRNGHHTVPPAVAIGPEADGHTLDPIVPIPASHSRLIDTSHRAKPNKQFYFSFEDHPIQMSPRSSPVPVPTARPAASVAAAGAVTPNTRPAMTPAAEGAAPSVSTEPGSSTGVAPTLATETVGHSEVAAEAPKPSAEAARPTVASPTALPARYNLGTNLGTPVPANGPALSMAVSGEEPLTVTGAIDKVAGRGVLVRSADGSQQVLVPDGARLERESRGRVSDLRPGDMVGVWRQPNGPALSVRVYSQGQGMPRPGIVPMTGARLGQIAVFGKIVAFQGNSIVVNSGAETTSIALPGGVEVLKPAAASLSDLAVGASLTATGNLGADGVLTATAARLTAGVLPAR